MQVKITITEKCNAKCTSCLTPSIKNPKHMSLDIFKEIIDEIIDTYFIDVVHLYSVGESLLNPEFQTMLDYAIPRLQHAKKRTVLTTNGSIDLTNFNLTGINEVVVSFNAFTKKIYEEHIQLSWDGVLKNIKKIADVRPIQVHILNYNQETDMSQDVLDMASHSNIRTRIGNKVDNQLGEFYEDNDSKRIPCDYVTNMLIFNVNGDVILCSHDFHSEHVYGNIEDFSIRELYNLKKEDIDLHNKLKFKGLCENCNYNKRITGDMFKWI